MKLNVLSSLLLFLSSVAYFLGICKMERSRPRVCELMGKVKCDIVLFALDAAAAAAYYIFFASAPCYVFFCIIFCLVFH